MPNRNNPHQFTGLRAYQWFELAVDNDIDPMELLAFQSKQAGGFDTTGWEYAGPALSGKQILRAQLILLGPVRNLEDAKERADRLNYRLVEGQARESFIKRFSNPNRIYYVAFGGSEWRDNSRNLCFFLTLGGYYFSKESFGWDLEFYCSHGTFDLIWYWLVTEK